MQYVNQYAGQRVSVYSQDVQDEGFVVFTKYLESHASLEKVATMSEVESSILISRKWLIPWSN